MSFFSGLLGSVGSSFVNSAIGSLTSSIGSSLFDAGSSLLNSVSSGLGGLFGGDKAGSVDHNSLFPDVFESKSSVVPSLSVAAPKVEMHGAGASSFSSADRFASSFNLNDEPAPVKISSALDSLPSISSDAPSLQLRQPVTTSAQFDRLFPSFSDDVRPKMAELELNQAPGFLSSEELLRASQADSFNTSRPEGARRFGTDNFLTDDERRAALYGAIRTPGANDAWRDRTVDTVNGEVVVRKSASEKAFDAATMLVPFGLGRAGKAAIAAEAAVAGEAAVGTTAAARFPIGSIIAREGVEIPAAIGRETPIYRAMNLTEMNGAEWLAGSGSKAERYAGWNMGAGEGYDYVSTYSAGGGFKQTTVGQILDAGGRIEVIDNRMIAIRFPESGSLPGSIWQRLIVK